MTLESHEQELRDLYDQLPPAFPGKDARDAKLVNYAILEAVVDKMMAKAYYYGKIETIQGVENFLDTKFSRYKK